MTSCYPIFSFYLPGAALPASGAFLPGMQPSGQACMLAASQGGEWFLWSLQDKGCIKAAEEGISFPALNTLQVLILYQAGTKHWAGQTNLSSLWTKQWAGNEQGKLTQAQHPPKVTAGHPIPRPALSELMGLSPPVSAPHIHQVKLLLLSPPQQYVVPDHPAKFWALKKGVSASSLLHCASCVVTPVVHGHTQALFHPLCLWKFHLCWYTLGRKTTINRFLLLRGTPLVILSIHCNLWWGVYRVNAR